MIPGQTCPVLLFRLISMETEDGRVLKYLDRYTHRVAIGNQRIDAFHDDGRGTFTYNDYLS